MKKKYYSNTFQIVHWTLWTGRVNVFLRWSDFNVANVAQSEKLRPKWISKMSLSNKSLLIKILFLFNEFNYIEIFL